MQSKNLLYIIDGYGIFFRAFFAMKNVPAHLYNYNAIFGTMRMILSIINQFSPENMIVALDAGSKTFRDDLYLEYILSNHIKTLIEDFEQSFQDDILSKKFSNEELTANLNLDINYLKELCHYHKIEINYHSILMIYKNLINFESNVEVVKSKYKANRAETPEQLKSQFAILNELLDSMNLPYLRKANYEADDIIATLCKQHKDNYNIIIISSDKDLMQLIDQKVKIYNPVEKKMIDGEVFYGMFGFESKYFGDYLALLGDKADNIPGVNGIGKKGAMELIKSYKTIDSIIKNLKLIHSEKLKKLITANIDILKLSHALIKLDSAVALDDIDFSFALNNKSLVNFIDKYNLRFNLENIESSKEENDNKKPQQTLLFE